MRAEHNMASMSLFELSRMGATDNFDEYTFEVQIASCKGPGIQIQLSCGEDELILWASERLWCRWLEPQLAVNAFSDVDPDLMSLLASWSLSPLNNWAQQKGLPGLELLAVELTEPEINGWCITGKTEGRLLPLHVIQGPDHWLNTLIDSMEPSQEQQHSLALIMGWCLIPEAEIENIVPGVALPIYGMSDEADCFWLSLGGNPAKLRFEDLTHAVVVEAMDPMTNTTPDTHLLSIEVGHVRLFAKDMVPWEQEQELDVEVLTYPLVNLIHQEEIWAQGQLIQFEQSWAVKIIVRKA